MRKKPDKTMCGLAAAALILTVGAQAGRAMAYFTASVTVAGGRQIHLLPVCTEIEEEPVIGWRKRITVNNIGERSCYVRLKVFVGESERLTFFPGSSWKKGAEADEYGNAYYYYREVLPAGASTGEFQVQIAPEGMTDAMDVIVVQECTPADLYARGLDPESAEWTGAAEERTEVTISREGGKGNGV